MFCKETASATAALQLSSYLLWSAAAVKDYLLIWEFPGGMKDIDVPKAKVQQDRKSQAYFHPSPTSALLSFLAMGLAAASSTQAGHTVSPWVTLKHLTLLLPE